ncbi:aldehyde dehydrogenase family protein [Burkholderia pyrrocinia]|uniref:Aldehyde dehydrogenase family protein n=1 Tax=Burkholderia pyrrocinia TaxID=60550 RepID=A0ABZ3BUC9_BURPY
MAIDEAAARFREQQVNAAIARNARLPIGKPAPFGGVKDSGLGYKEGVQEAMKRFTNAKTHSQPW